MKENLYQVPVFVTGASGFIGQHLVRVLLGQGAIVTILSRSPAADGEQRYKTIVGNLTYPATLEGICRDVKTVFHLGGYAHAVDHSDDKSASTNWQVTVEGTKALIEQSIKAGVSRFLFFSSAKAMGEGGEICLDETTESQPVTSYGKAKREAEKLVLEAAQYGLSPTVLRLPMVYGPGCKGNLPRMIQAVACGRFPPLPDTRNKRSMVDVRDVVQATMLAATNPVATGKIYVVTDGKAYTTRQIYEWICAALGRPVPRWVIPLVLLRFAAHIGDTIGRLSGRRFVLDTDALDKLLGSAWYSSEKISRELGYKPAYTLKDSLPEMVAEFRKNQ
jgi:nucleoside-diphosphate-sugar epimerase